MSELQSTSENQYSIGVAADFNSHNFCRLLERSVKMLSGRCYDAPFGQTLALLHDRNAEFWQTKYDALVIWTFPELAVPEFGKALEWKPFSMEQLLAEVDAFAELVENTAASGTVILPTWSLAAYGHGLGPDRKSVV